MTPPADPSITLLMPFANAAADVGDVLASIGAQIYDRARISVVAIDCGSTDGSVAIVERWFALSGIRGKLIHAGRLSAAHALNCAIMESPPDDYIARLDVHAIYGRTYIARIAEAFAQAGPAVWCVGTTQEPVASTLADRVVAALMTNRMGLGGADYRVATEPTLVRSVYLGAWRPGVLQRLGGFDERWHANEDAEMAARLRAMGGTILWIALECRYRITRGPLPMLKRWTRFGYWRAQTLRRHPGEVRPRHVAPSLALAAAAAGELWAPHSWLLLPLALYVAAIVTCRRRGEHPLATLASLLYFPAVHIANAGGFLYGLTFGWAHPRMRVFGIGDRPRRNSASSRLGEATA